MHITKEKAGELLGEVCCCGIKRPFIGAWSSGYAVPKKAGESQLRAKAKVFLVVSTEVLALQGESNRVRNNLVSPSRIA
jgi:hypothetical protein